MIDQKRGKRIYLTGFMGCGKSTIGPVLANMLGWNFYDLDSEIEKRENMSIVQIFEKQGEKYFRELEKEILIKISEKDKIVVSLGGGTIVAEENLFYMKQSGVVVYIEASVDVLYNRIKSKTDRPLVRDIILSSNPKEKLHNLINNLLEKRLPFYQKADITVKSDSSNFGKNVDEIFKKIIWSLNEEN
ncbi:MAG: shikimate kinase [Ignavibacteriales bacterium]|nr:shikimate kinase [Ignavibacteriales bacterium]